MPRREAQLPPWPARPVRKVKKVVGYGLQLREKQKAKRIYFTLETQFRAYYQKAANKTGVTGELLLQQLETRLDNVGLPPRLRDVAAASPARSFVTDTSPSTAARSTSRPSRCKVGDEIAIREGSKKLVVLEESKNFAGGQRSVPWLDINRDNLSGKVIALPKREDVNLPVNEQLIVELYCEVKLRSAQSSSVLSAAKDSAFFAAPRNVMHG